MDIRSSALILTILFFSQQHSTHCVWWNNENETYYLSDTTFTSDSSKLQKGASIINFANVNIPDSSLELFAHILSKVRQLYLYNSPISRIYLPSGLLKLSISHPAESIEIVIEQNVSYSLKAIDMMYFDKLPEQITHLHALEHFSCKSTPVVKLDLELFARMENLTTFSMIKTSTKDIILPRLQQFPKLRLFSVWGSNLTTFNATSSNFPSLKDLDLSFNNFTILPQQIATFGTLSRLSMRSNHIKSIDMHIFTGLRRLAILDLQSNHISSIAGELQLPMLTELRLGMNRLVELDVSQWYLPALDFISLRCNLLKTVIGFTKCFGNVTFIDMNECQWGCSWLEEVGRSIRGMVISYIQHNSSVQYCHGMRLVRS